MKLKYILALVMCLVVTPAKAELQIDVNGAMRDPLPLAFPEMIHEGFWVGQYAGKIRSVVIADLERSGLFRIIPENSYIQELTSVDEQPNFVDWKAINAHALVQSAVKEVNPNTLRVEFRLWDVYAENQLKGQSFTTTKDNWRRLCFRNRAGDQASQAAGDYGSGRRKPQVFDFRRRDGSHAAFFAESAESDLYVLCRFHAESLYSGY